MELSFQAQHLVESLNSNGAATATELAVLVFRGFAQQRVHARFEANLVNTAQTFSLATATEACRELGVQGVVAADQTVDQDQVSLIDCVIFVFGHLK